MTDTSPSAELRQAAETLRGMASVQAEQEWKSERFFWKFCSDVMPDGWWWGVQDSTGDVALISEQDDDGDDTAENRARYIATMHPGVGLALADWLDDEFGHEFGPTDHAINIARLINGGAA